MEWKVPLVEIEVTDGDVEAVLECLRSGWLTMGPRTQAFEAALAERLGVEHAVAVSSGTAALHLACRAAGLGPGDEAIVPSFAFVAAAHAPRYLGADVVLCDSAGPEDPGLDPARVESLIGPRTKAVLAVHMWGYAAAVEELRSLCDERGLILIEDCAEAIGAQLPGGGQVGSVGDVGCFSFFSKKQLAVGEGGVVATDDDEVAATVRSLRSHAMTSVTWERHRGHGLGYDVTDVVYNYRMDEPRAALGLSRVERLDADIEVRRGVAAAYRDRLRGVQGLELPFDDDEAARSSHFVFPVLLEGSETRDRLRIELRDSGIQSTCYPAIHSFSEYRDNSDPGLLPNAGEIADRHLALPLHAGLDPERIELVSDRVRAFLEPARPTG
jgi:dTDP-4-amino-4,6-dideoxygalactose transaminase